MDEEIVNEKIEQIHEHLTATQEHPVERAASRWIGEAEAIARDLVEAEADSEVVHRRLRHVLELLDNVDETGDEMANEHVTTAMHVARDVVDSIE